jgi:hypothetical protein
VGIEEDIVGRFSYDNIIEEFFLSLDREVVKVWVWVKQRVNSKNGREGRDRSQVDVKEKKGKEQTEWRDAL